MSLTLGQTFGIAALFAAAHYASIETVTKKPLLLAAFAIVAAGTAKSVWDSSNVHEESTIVSNTFGGNQCENDEED